jgi:hypothetical protein
VHEESPCRISPRHPGSALTGCSSAGCGSVPCSPTTPADASAEPYQVYFDGWKKRCDMWVKIDALAVQAVIRRDRDRVRSSCRWPRVPALERAGTKAKTQREWLLHWLGPPNNLQFAQFRGIARGAHPRGLQSHAPYFPAGPRERRPTQRLPDRCRPRACVE